MHTDTHVRHIDKHIHIEKRLESFTWKYFFLFPEMLAVFTMH